MTRYIQVDEFPLPPVQDRNYTAIRPTVDIIDDHICILGFGECGPGFTGMHVPAGEKVMRFNEGVPPMRKRVPR